MVAETSEDAAKAIEFLHKEKKGRARVWILDKIPPVTGHTELGTLTSGFQLLSRVQCPDTFKPLLNYLFSTYWIQGSTIYGNAFINGGVDPAQWKSHVFHRLPELKKTLKDREAEKSKLDLDLNRVFEQKAEFNQKRDAAMKELEEVRIRLEVAVEERNKLTQRMNYHQEENKVSLQEHEQIQAETTKSKQLLDESTNLFNQLQSQEKSDHEQLELRQQELTELQQLHIAASAELSAKMERHNSYQEKLNWQKSILEQTQKDMDNIQNTLKHYEEAFARTQTDIVEAKNAQNDAKEQINIHLQNKENAQMECEVIQKERVSLADKIAGLEIEVKTERESLGEVQSQIQNEMISQTTLKSKTEILSQKLYEQYELTLEQAKATYQGKLADPEQLDRLKKRVANIGPVNLAAPQEFEELVQKNTFLTTQKDDLVKAKEDLREVIAKINATTREHFRETFQKVRENFRNIYGLLFQGGEADLYFTNEADILSTGIDIYCQPPGKKLTHISLLSGGEKALTAGALLFAFFMVRPSPVALLDEVDAPLDDANVTRFVRLIKQLSEKTQFFIITHNKLTMEAGSTLYGVTMEELGVSKVLSTRLQKEKSVAPEPVAAR